MPAQTLLRALLPGLRRYARAAAGQAAAADAALREAMPDIVEALQGAAPSDLETCRRRALSVLIHCLSKARVLPFARNGRLDGAIASLPPEQRHALLLSLLEDLPREAVAEILGIRPSVVDHQLMAARISLRGFMPARVMIIEDEPLVAMDLTAVVESLGHAVCSIASDEAEACRVAVEARPELILADVHLGAGGSGLAAARRIKDGIRVPIVFVTGRPELLASERNALVVRKPFLEDALVTAIGRALASRATLHAG